MFDIGGSAAALTGWYTDAFKPPCMKGFDTYLRQVKFSPDGSYIVVAATGRASSAQKLCDSAARFETEPDRPAATRPGCSAPAATRCYAVAVTGAGRLSRRAPAVVRQPVRHATATGAGPGAVARPGHRRGQPEHRQGAGVESDPRRAAWGYARSWHRPDGLLVGSDTDQLGQRVPRPPRLFPMR